MECLLVRARVQTRDAFIDLLLSEAGWTLSEARDREYPVKGMPHAKGDGFADYVLWGDLRYSLFQLQSGVPIVLRTGNYRLGGTVKWHSRKRPEPLRDKGLRTMRNCLGGTVGWHNSRQKKRGLEPSH